MKKKRLIARWLALALCLIATLTASAYEDDYDFMVDNIAYLIIGDHEVAVTSTAYINFGSYNFEYGEGERYVTIDPGEWNYPGGYEVIIPSTVYYRGVYYTVTRIGRGAFAFANLSKVAIPASVRGIGQAAFYDSHIDYLEVDLDAWFKIYYYDSDMSYDKNIDQGSIWDGGQMYEEHERFSSYVILDYYYSLSIDWGYDYEVGDSPISVQESESYGVRIHELYEYGTGELITDLVIPDGVRNISNLLFMGNTALRTITFHENMESIDCYSFKGCTGLRSIYAKKPIPIPVGSDAFKDVPVNTCVLHVPVGSKTLYKNADGWKDFTIIVEDIESVIKGDVNGDGRVDINDVNAVVNLILGRSTLYRDRADVTGDGKVSVSDLNAIVNVMLGRTK